MQLEEGNAALLHQAAPVLELLAADALSAEPAQAARALTALSTVLAADPTGGSAEGLYRTSLPGRILADLQEGPHRALTQVGPAALHALHARCTARQHCPTGAACTHVGIPVFPQHVSTASQVVNVHCHSLRLANVRAPPLAAAPCRPQPPPHGQALLLVSEAQLTLLLRLALAGPPAARSASAQRLFGLHALAKLSQCRAIDLQPEEPGFGQYTGGRGRRGPSSLLVRRSSGARVAQISKCFAFAVCNRTGASRAVRGATRCHLQIINLIPPVLMRLPPALQARPRCASGCISCSRRCCDWCWPS